jgi:hypothetical protein
MSSIYFYTIEKLKKSRLIMYIFVKDTLLKERNLRNFKGNIVTKFFFEIKYTK